MILILEARARPLAGLARGLEVSGRSVSIASEVDLSSMKSVRAAVAEVKPEAVVLTGGLEDPLECEEDPARAFVLNAEGAIHLAAAALEFRAIPILISTAAVFGDDGREHSEDETPDPKTTYGRSKLQGETFLLRAAKRGLVIRVGHVFEDGLAFERAEVEVRAASERELVSPTGAADLGRVIDRLLAAGAAGVIHAAAPEPPVSDLDLWRAVASACGGTGGQVGASSRKGGAALLCGRLGALGIQLRPWREALADAAARDPATSPKPSGELIRKLAPGEAIAGRGPVEIEVRFGKVVLEQDEDSILRPGQTVRVEGGYRVVAIDPSHLLVRS